MSKPRKKPTVDDHLKRYEKLLTFINEEIDKRAKIKEKGTRVLRSVRKMVKSLMAEVPKISKHKPKKTGEPRMSGLKVECSITDELADFLEIERGTKLSRMDVLRAINVYCKFKHGELRPDMLKWGYLNKDKKRDLQNPANRRELIPDKKLSKLLRYEQYKKDVKDGKIKRKRKNDDENSEEKYIIETVEDDSLHYKTIQKLIQVHFL